MTVIEFYNLHGESWILCKILKVEFNVRRNDGYNRGIWTIVTMLQNGDKLILSDEGSENHYYAVWGRQHYLKIAAGFSHFICDKATAVDVFRLRKAIKE